MRGQHFFDLTLPRHFREFGSVSLWQANAAGHYGTLCEVCRSDSLPPPILSKVSL
jgi:hypothetical protein